MPRKPTGTKRVCQRCGVSVATGKPGRPRNVCRPDCPGVPVCWTCRRRLEPLRRKFCSESCDELYRKFERAAKATPRWCSVCGREFYSTYKRRHVCSEACRKDHHKRYYKRWYALYGRPDRKGKRRAPAP